MDDDRWAGWPERWVGTDCDVRTAVGAISREVKDGFRYDEVPWQRFRHFYGPGEEIPDSSRRSTPETPKLPTGPCGSSG